MPLVNTVTLAIARALVAVLRDLLDGIGALVQSIGKVALVLAIGTTPFYMLWLASRSAEHQSTPPIFWQAIPITWLACALVWQLGSLLRSLAHPNRTRSRLVTRQSKPVSAERIHEWDAAWQRAILHQQHTRRNAAGGGRRPGDQHRQQPTHSSTPDSPYDILGVHPSATPDEIRTAYRELAMRLHPDHNPGFIREATERFRHVQTAYQALSDPGRRAQHDRQSI